MIMTQRTCSSAGDDEAKAESHQEGVNREGQAEGVRGEGRLVRGCEHARDRVHRDVSCGRLEIFCGLLATQGVACEQ